MNYPEFSIVERPESLPMRRGKYTRVFAALRELKDGDCLKFSPALTEKEGRAIRSSATFHKIGVSIRTDSGVTYVWRNGSNNGKSRRKP